MDKPAGVLSQKASVTDFSANEWLIGYLLSQKKLTAEALATFHPSVCKRLIETRADCCYAASLWERRNSQG
ncbi:MAG: hypothetical protein ACLURV_11475 [Gallintestinimicrobium sp.]